MFENLIKEIDFDGVSYFIAPEYKNVDSMLLMIKGVFSAPFLSILALFTEENFNLTPAYSQKMIYLLLYQLVILGLCKGLWANLSFKEGKSIKTSFIWIFKPLMVVLLLQKMGHIKKMGYIAY